ncbi:MAG: type II toxin-antitoxin system HicA family toxin [Candidatus Omnitrophota bacterium]|nr:type II toxin-antitoxin system HicA family toxin [Candidatus Omnitrophota bacterium]
MSRLTPLKTTETIRILNRLGFTRIRQKGSHIYFRHLDGRSTVVPFHKGEDLGRGLLKAILRDIDLSWEKFIAAK